MPEEKKESFTFSDKIRNSKSPASASFANRISSKIGSNGRPKKTLFERTKRDAPFFIAALAALLLLPFLYKYSGQVNEEPVIAPSSEDTVFDPERYGFDTAVTDPDGQIAQLSARDPLSLIKGWGSDDEETPDVSYDYDRSGLDDSSSSYTSSPTTETTTNIYRRTAAPATRAAVRRSTTKIKEMGRAAMASAGGGLNITPWGGSLKGAAKKVSGPDYKTPPKPVSLQPLQAVGRPQRGYFGMGAGEQARRSAQALTKGNAMQALRDAQYAPINPGRVGGLSSGESRGPGGQSDLKHGFGYNGITPWWWDLMKTRSQMEWEKRFNRKWDWIGWADKLAQNILGGIINCLITGEDDGGMGGFWGASGDSAVPEMCKCPAGDFTTVESLAASMQIQVGKGAKLSKLCKTKKAADDFGCRYEPGKGGGGNLNWYQKRLYCMGATVKGKGDAAIAVISSNLEDSCADFKAAKAYDFRTGGKASNWHTYHMVVAKNISPYGDGRYLCGFDSSRQYNKATASGVNDVNAALSLQEAYDQLKPLEDELAALSRKTDKESKALFKQKSSEVYKLHFALEKARKEGRKTVGNDFSQRLQQIGVKQGRYNFEGINRNSAQHDCVIYVATGENFDYRKFSEEMVLLFARMRGSNARTFQTLEKYGKDKVAYEGALSDFRALDLSYIQGFASKDALAVDGALKANGGLLPGLPMIYWDFQRSYLDRTKGRASGYDKPLDQVYKRKKRTVGENILFAQKCEFEDVAITGDPLKNNSPEAVLTISEGESQDDYNVTAVLRYNDSAVTLNIPSNEIERLGPVVVNGQTMPNQYRFRVKDAKKLLKAQHPELFDQNGNIKPEYDLSNTQVKQNAIITWTAAHKQSGKKATSLVDKEQQAAKVQEPVEISKGTGLASWSCENKSSNKVFVGNSRNLATLSFNDVLNKAPLLCPECKNKEAKDAVQAGLANIQKLLDDNAQKRTNNLAAGVKNGDPVMTELDSNINQLNTLKRELEAIAVVLDDNSKNLTIRQYLHIMELLAEQQGSQIPAKNVCYLARSVSAISADPDVVNPALPNTFGTFAIYVDADSYLFPQQRILFMDANGTSQGKEGPDGRFAVSGSMATFKQNDDARLHWGYYDHSFWDGNYQNALADAGINMNQFPLQKLKLSYPGSITVAIKNPKTGRMENKTFNGADLYKDAINPPTNGELSYDEQKGGATGGYRAWSGGADVSNGGTQARRAAYHQVYNKPFYNAGGCEVYNNAEAFTPEEVMSYLNLLCTNGLNFKVYTGYNYSGLDGRGYDTKKDNKARAGEGVLENN